VGRGSEGSGTKKTIKTASYDGGKKTAEIVHFSGSTDLFLMRRAGKNYEAPVGLCLSKEIRIKSTVHPVLRKALFGKRENVREKAQG